MIDIYGTLGPSCSSRQVLADMFAAGMTGVRLNLSHVSLRESADRLEVFHEAARMAGVKPRLLIDMQGPELRIGRLPAPQTLSGGQEIFLFPESVPETADSGGLPADSFCQKESVSAPEKPAEASYKKSAPEKHAEAFYKKSAPEKPAEAFLKKTAGADPVGARSCERADATAPAAIPVPDAVFGALRTGAEILLDDGRLLLQVIGEEGGFARCAVLRGGLLSGRKSIKIRDVQIHPPTMTAADLANIRDAVSFGVTGIMQPFVRSRADLIEVRRALSENGAGDLQLVAKIENREGMRQLGGLLSACDAVCIARGDLGNDMDLWQLPLAQKQIAAACRAAGRYFMVATQMLTSMEERAVPTRAEVNDIFNTVADGASGVMITGESAVGKYPVEAIRFLARTAREGELYREKYRV